MADELISITVDGRTVEVADGELLIKAAQDNGTYIPRFCWHSRMKPVGMCRMCLVEVDTPRGKRMVTSCTTPCNDGMVVDTESDVVKKAQEGILEFLLINHPLDCPVCDRGGECPLQDQTMAYGPGESRFVEEKRHFEKPIEISDLVLLDRERCILCARCTRFSDEISGDPLIEFKERGNYTQVLTFPDEPFASYFSGNTVQICPVGALTAKPYRFRARPWDLEAVESTCTTCSVGCRMSVQASQNQVLRYLGVDNDATNQSWLCDKGRFGFEAVGSSQRLASPLIRGADGELHESSWSEALELVAERLSEVRGDEVAGLGGARGTNEEAFAFGKFMRTVVVSPHVDAQLGDGLDPGLLVGLHPRATIADLETARTIILWGPDLKEELPVLYLRVRRAAQELGANLLIVHPRRTGLDDVATRTIAYRPGDGIETLASIVSDTSLYDMLSEGPVIGLIGRPGLAEDVGLAEAVAAWIRDLPDAKLLPLARRGNVYGALDMGLAPTLLPGRASTASDAARADLERVWHLLPEGVGRDAAGILKGMVEGDVKALVMLGVDPIRDYPDRALATAALDAAEFVVSMDTFLNDSSDHADVVLPVDGFAESEGTVTNLEGRVQKVNKLVPGPGQSRPAWAVLDDLGQRMGGDLGATSAEALSKEIATVAPAYRGISWELLDWGEGREGVVVPSAEGEQPLQYVPVARSTNGSAPKGFALHLARVLYDDGVLTRMSPSMSRLIPDATIGLHPADLEALGVREGATVRVSAGARGALELPARADASLVEGTVYVPANLPETAELGAVLSVTVGKVK